jgi:UDP-2-acetamido-2,6-beta-L-arabino-hexul-4-ose reductase
VSGKWCRPNYNSAVATFCYNTAHGLPINVNDPAVSWTWSTSTTWWRSSYALWTAVRTRSAAGAHGGARAGGGPRRLLPEFYSTYSSYLPTDAFSYPLLMNTNERGSFTEFLRTPDRGQVSINVSRPGILKGNHLISR